MKEVLKNILLNIDLFGTEISLRLNKASTSQTIIGGVCTILMIGAIIGFFWVQAVDVMRHVNPKISINSGMLNNREYFNINSHNMPIAFGITDSGSKTYNLSRYLTFSVSNVSNNNTASSTFVEEFINIKNCEKNDFPSMSQKLYDYYGLNLLYCINNLNTTIGGYWSEIKIQYLSIRAKLCTESTHCESLNNIKSFLRSNTYFFNIYLLNNNLNTQIQQNPVQQNLLNIYYGINTNSYKYVELLIKHNTLISDESLLFSLETPKNHTTISYDYRIMDENLISDNTVMEYAIMSSENKTTYLRVYTKISDLLANIGGLAHFLLKAFYIICWFFSTMKRDVEILNTIYHFDISSCDESNDGKRSSKISKLSEEFKKKYSAKLSYISSNFEIKNKEEEKKDIMISNIESNFMQSPENLLRQYKLTQLNSLRKKSIDIMSLISYPSQFKKSIDHTNNNNTDKIKTEERELKKSPTEEIKENESENEQYKMNKSAGHLRKKVTNLILEKKSEIEIKELVDNIVSTKKLKHHLEFSYYELIKILLFRCCMRKRLKNKFKLYKKSEETLDEALDICSIIQKLDEFEKLRMILLTKPQMSLFNFISKDWCSLNNSILQNSKIHEMRVLYNDQEALAKIFINFLQELNSNNHEKNKFNEVNEKLLEFLHEDFKNNFLQS